MWTVRAHTRMKAAIQWAPSHPFGVTRSKEARLRQGEGKKHKIRSGTRTHTCTLSQLLVAEVVAERRVCVGAVCMCACVACRAIVDQCRASKRVYQAKHAGCPSRTSTTQRSQPFLILWQVRGARGKLCGHACALCDVAQEVANHFPVATAHRWFRLVAGGGG